jgi:hypothetical protein
MDTTIHFPGPLDAMLRIEQIRHMDLVHKNLVLKQ